MEKRTPISSSHRSYSNASFLANSNAVGDGKYDQDFFPSNLEMFVGRIDFARLPVFGTSNAPSPAEANLVKQYFDKAHKYRYGLSPYPLPQDAIVYSSFNANPHDDLNNLAVFKNAMRNAAALFGSATTNLVVGDAYFQSPGLWVIPRSYLWGFAGGSGNSDGINGGTGNAHYSINLTVPANESSIGFYLLKGSYFGDWNVSDDFMRATLATANFGLATMWTIDSEWRLHGMAMGEPLGNGLLRTANNPDGGTSDKSRILAILGDPTLRLHTLTPPASLTGVVSSVVTLTWNTNNAPGVTYYVYKSSGSGPFVPITPNPIAGPSKSDASSYNTGTNYMVRGLKLQTSGSGSYTNISQGSFWP